jgi:hypothetical protein
LDGAHAKGFFIRVGAVEKCRRRERVSGGWSATAARFEAAARGRSI